MSTPSRVGVIRRWLTARHERGLRRAAAISRDGNNVSPRLMSARVLALWLVVVLFVGFLDSSESWGFGLGFGWFEGYAYNMASALRARLVEPLTTTSQVTASRATNVVIVPLSDETFSPAHSTRLPGPPVSRAYHAKLIRFLAKSRAKIVAFDIIFDATRPEDKEFADAVQFARRLGTRVVWGCARDENDQLILPNARLRRASQDVAHVLVERNPTRPLTERVVAFVNGDARVGTTPNVIPALSLKVVEILKGIDRNQPQRIATGWRIGNMLVPIEGDGTYAISYVSAQGGAFPYVPYESLVAPGGDAAFYQELFKNKVVLVGDTTKLGNDWKDTPLGIMPGVEVHAHAINTLLHGNFLHSAPVWMNLWIVALLPGILALFHNSRATRTLSLVIATLFVGYLLLALWLFVVNDYSLHIIGPLTALSIFATLLLIERGVREEREKQRMFDALVIAASSAIESRDPSTAGHSRRVTCFTVELAIAVSCERSAKFCRERFSKAQIKELCYSALLHDFGKIGVREAVLTKSHKLDPMHFQVVKHRLLLRRAARQTEYWQRRVQILDSGDDRMQIAALLQELDAEYEQWMADVEHDLQQLEKANDPQVTFLPDAEYTALQDLLHRLAVQTFPDEHGVECPLITSEESSALLIRKGSLTTDEYRQIQNHAQMSFDFLKQIKWTSDLEKLPFIAWGHHEKLNGAGYPRGVKAEEIPLATRMMTIADIYDALTAADRPYKRALPTEKALQILQSEVDSGALDADLFAVFVEWRIYEAVNDQRYARLFEDILEAS